MLLLLQDDDMIDPDFLETCLKAAEGAGEPGLIRTGYRVIDGDGKVHREAVNRVAGLSLSDFFWLSSRERPPSTFAAHCLMPPS